MREYNAMDGNRVRLVKDLGGRSGIFPPFRTPAWLLFISIALIAILSLVYFAIFGPRSVFSWFAAFTIPIVYVPLIVNYKQMKWITATPEWNDPDYQHVVDDWVAT